jgi:hypothetical protein
MFPMSPSASGMPSGAPFNRCASILWQGHTILRATRIFKICAPGLAGFEAIRIYYLVDEGAIRVIRILHGKRDVKRILEGEQGL